MADKETRYQHRTKIFLVFCLLLFPVAGCEKFTGYQYDADDVGVNALIHGKVRNIFDRNAVRFAPLRIGETETVTDSTGSFSVIYLLGIDDDRNRPVDVLFRSPDYYPLDTSLVVFPPETEFNLDVVYASPVIKQAYSGTIPVVAQGSGEIFFHPVAQILLLDYQGISSVDSCSATFFYTRTGDPEFVEYTLGMIQMEILSETSAYYQAVGPAIIGENYLYYDRELWLFSQDDEGYRDTVGLDDAQVFQSQPLFPIVADP